MKRKRILWTTILIVILLAAGCSVYQYLGKNKFSNLPIEGISEELINTEKEAVEFAKQDTDIISFANRHAELGIDYSAYYDRELGVWQVVIYAVNARDLDYQISFYPNGTITFKGPIPL